MGLSTDKIKISSSHTRVGCDVVDLPVCWAEMEISIHAPARGATQNLCLLVLADGISIHAPARGATDGLAYVQNAASISIHAPARGATFGASYDWLKNGISIHAPARGATANIHKSTLLFVLSIYLLHKHLSIFWRLSSLLFHSACPSCNFSVRTHRGISVHLDFAPP